MDCWCGIGSPGSCTGVNGKPPIPTTNKGQADSCPKWGILPVSQFFPKANRRCSLQHLPPLSRRRTRLRLRQKLSGCAPAREAVQGSSFLGKILHRYGNSPKPGCFVDGYFHVEFPACLREPLQLDGQQGCLMVRNVWLGASNKVLFV